MTRGKAVAILNREAGTLSQSPLLTDLTQRASAIEYRKAREFLQDLHSPWIAVPGNHDIPFYNVARRFFPLPKDIGRTSIKNSAIACGPTRQMSGSN
jgi:3',5'-cyclic AMP phosphodiesterase CpdA